MESNLGLREKGVQAFRLVAHDSCWAMALTLCQEQPAVVRQGLVLPCSRGKEGAEAGYEQGPLALPWGVLLSPLGQAMGVSGPQQEGLVAVTWGGLRAAE